MVLTVLFALPMVANAAEAEIVYSGTCGASGSSVNWSLDSNGHLLISGTGKMKDYNSSSMPWYNYLNDIKTATIESGVTSIGNRAFSKCVNLEEITIANTVTSIGNYAFFQCHSLPEINIPKNVTTIGTSAFYECNIFTTVTLPYGVTTIGQSAFARCTQLREINIPASVTSIGISAFDRCINLTEITIPESVTSIGASAFTGCTKLAEVIMLSKTVTIDSTATTIPATATICAYEGSTAAAYATPNGNGFASISSCGAQGDNLLWYLTPDGKLVIFGSGAMGDYYSGSIPWYNVKSSIKSVVIKDGVTSIGKHAFHNCSTIQAVSIPDSVTLIDEYAFYNCDSSKLTSITIPNGVTTIGLRAFSELDYLNEITIPASVTSIGAGAFSACKRLGTVVVAGGNTAYYIADNCLIERATKTIIQGFNTSTIPDDGSVFSIGNDAFSGCTGLTEITIPNSVKTIGSGAFNKCTGLTDINILSRTTVIADSETTFPAGATIHGYADSTAYTYARTYNRTFVAFKTEGNIDWQFDQNTGTLSIFGEGDMADYTPENPAPWSIYADSVRKVIVENGVSSIGTCAFDGCNNLSEVIILSENTTIYGDDGAIPALAIVYGYSTNIGAQNYAGQYERTFVEVDTCGVRGDNLLWYLTDDGMLVIFGTGDMENYTEDSPAPWYSVSETIENVVIKEGVEAIGDRAFVGCSYLAQIRIPASVISIGRSVAVGCKKLAIITVADGNLAYYSEGNCLIQKQTKTVVLGCKNSEIPADGSVTAIGEMAFEGCYGLTKIAIPASVNSIGQGAFKDCVDLVDVIILSNTVSIYSGEDTFPDHATIYAHSTNFAAQSYAEQYERTFVEIATCGAQGDNLLWYLSPQGELVIFGTGEMANYLIDDPAPWNNHAASIKKITIQDGVTTIGDYVFANCTNLINVVIPNGVTVIGDGAFSYCYKLTGVVIPEGVTEIGAYAFYYCVRLFEIEIPASVTSIGRGVVANCKILSAITVKAENAVYSSDGNCLIEGTTLIAGCNSSEIPNTVTVIGDSAFSGCSLLTELAIPESVTAIGSLAFQDCAALTAIEIPATVTEIGEGILAGCDKLETITVSAGNSVYYVEDNCLIKRETNTLVAGFKDAVIPEDVTAIGRGAFLGCRTLTEITIPATVASIDHAAFFVCDNVTEVVFEGKELSICDYEWTLPENAVLCGYDRVKVYATKYNRLYVCCPDDGTPVYTAAEFANAVENGGKVVVMKDIYLGDAVYDTTAEKWVSKAEDAAWTPKTLEIKKSLTISGADTNTDLAITIYRGIPFENGNSQSLTKVPMFKMSAGSEKDVLEIKNIIFDGQKAVTDQAGRTTGIVDTTTAYDRATNGGCFHIYQGTLVMQEGAVIQNFTANIGAAVFLYSAKANMIMNGGLIQNNDGYCTGSNYSGSAIAANYGDFVMTDGTITGNTSQYGAAAVYVLGNNTSGHFWMYGGEISDNVGKTNGGAIRLRSAHFYMYGGTIKNNEASGAKYGHAIFVNHAANDATNYSRIVLAGGTIESNSGANGNTPIYLASSDRSYLYIGESSIVSSCDSSGISAELIGEWKKKPLVLDAGSGNPIAYSNNATAVTNTYLASDLIMEDSQDSRVVLEDTGSAFMTVAEGYTPDGITLAAIRLRGADTLYNPIVNDDGTLAWPDANTTYQVVKSAGLNDAIDFRLYVAFRDTNAAQEVVATFDEFNNLSDKRTFAATREEGVATCVVIPMAPKQMTDEVTLTVGGVGDDTVYTLAQYLRGLTDYAKKRNDEKLGNLVSALLNYGSAAQVHFNYNYENNKNNLANTEYARDDLSDINTNNQINIVNGVVGAVNIFDSAVVNIDSKVSVCVVIHQPNEPLNLNAAEVTLGGKPRNFEVVYDDSEYAAIYILNISAAELMKDIGIKIGTSELTYSVPLYAERMKDYQYNKGDLNAMVKALYAYAFAAKAYNAK